MTYDGRSLDDLPLAAYSRARREALEAGEEPLEELDPEAAVAPEDLAGASGPALSEASEAPDAPLAADAASLDTSDEPASQPAAIAMRAAKERLRDVDLRDRRVLAGAGCVALILVGVLLLGSAGSSPGGTASAATQRPTAAAGPTHAPGAATLVLTGSLTSTYTLAGPGAEPPARRVPIAVTWSDVEQNALALSGTVDRGTRATDEALVLAWTLVMDGEPVTFESKAGECTIGMAVQGRSVTGSFACRRLKSSDGKYTVGATGTYRT